MFIIQVQYKLQWFGFYAKSDFNVKRRLSRKKKSSLYYTDYKNGEFTKTVLSHTHTDSLLWPGDTVP